MTRYLCVLGVTLAAAASASACGGADIEALCKAREDCLGGNEQDLDACAAIEGANEDRADILGCEDEYEAYTTCRTEAATCEDIDTGVACSGDEQCKSSGFVRCADGQCIDRDFIVKDPKACEAETHAYNRCDFD